MECHMKSRVKAMVEELAREHQQELAAAGTLVDLEELTCQIGDELARQLCENELSNRAEQAAELEQCECPECGRLCPRGQPEPVLLQGLRGEVGYNQPSYFCSALSAVFFSRWPLDWESRRGARSRPRFCGRWFGRAAISAATRWPKKPCVNWAECRFRRGAFDVW